MTRRFSFGRLLLGAALALLLSVPVSAQAGGEGEASVIWLVRHAERADAGMDDQPDPELSAVGRARAQELARFLGEAGITSIYSTPFRRTMQTALPLAEALGLGIETYDPRDADSMEAFHSGVRLPGRHLVVGHSNTTPALVEQLGGDPVSAIAVEEYDRIYVLQLTAGGDVQSTLLRFGAPAPGG
jgi:phosphohistidine phosphatase SixA